LLRSRAKGLREVQVFGSGTGLQTNATFVYWQCH